ncbi:hypothetical protein F4809DRAFT_638414 [Biscogniauxia mediterranea]|nr:hypothetical protein F4809DRAFT_638414 [Biscogniauxia mediterranea]
MPKSDSLCITRESVRQQQRYLGTVTPSRERLRDLRGLGGSGGGGGGGSSNNNDNNQNNVEYEVVYKWTEREYREGDPGGPEQEGTGSWASGRKGGHHDNTGTSSSKGGHHGGGGHHGARR